MCLASAKGYCGACASTSSLVVFSTCQKGPSPRAYTRRIGKSRNRLVKFDVVQECTPAVASTRRCSIGLELTTERAVHTSMTTTLPASDALAPFATESREYQADWGIPAPAVPQRFKKAAWLLWSTSKGYKQDTVDQNPH